ncbi:MAG: cobalamin B12-binding domain-containing protein [Chloroflexota bacterium]|nr:MAG: cobalamin B12-binding domain-containing protein [Chloroflexota bacterium]
MPNLKKTVVAAALGECVHVAGVMKFLKLAEEAGWETVFLGPAVPIGEVIKAAKKEKAELVAVSYRLTPETGERLLGEFAEAADELHSRGVRFAFGGTPPIANRVKALGFFDRTFEGGEPADVVLAYLKGQPVNSQEEADFPQNTIERILWKSPYPILRHHFGLPTLDKTRDGIRTIAEAQAIDVISLGIDQDAQENFFNPEKQNPQRRGAGGVPVRTAEDYQALYAASRHGNYPLMRTYSGTDNFIELAELYRSTINNAWCAIPLFWFNQMDRRGPWDLEGSIREHQQLMAWYGKQGLPVELNEPHHWGMRDAPDVIFVVSAYLAAYNAKQFGVQDYIAQLMFNSPPGLSDAMDLAKMLAVLELITPLADQNFRVWRQTRTGLLSYPLDIDAARAHLAASVYLQMSIKPHIVHIVGHTEADHAATAQDVIEASKIARRAIENALAGQPEMKSDPVILDRKEKIIQESRVTLKSIRELGDSNKMDPFIDPITLTKAVKIGILDAPQLRNNLFARGEIRSQIIKGANIAVDSNRQQLSEEERISSLIMDKV